ncbi:hypothetical protein SDC9_132430 [bioreactor metagenome]|uniref:Uncharacterized protein n=1 Tax=bioreactor metagenome TaxID=1076179 RepID=A0A645D7W2_9ZZZZ
MEPGSNRSEIEFIFVALGVADEVAVKVVIAKMPPVLLSITVIDPESALYFSTPFFNSFSTSN